MPYKIRKLPNKNLYRLSNVDTGYIYAKSTTLEKAKSQMRLLNAIDHGYIPSNSKRGRRRSSSIKRKR